MTDRRWKLSQIISLSFVGALLAFAVFGAFASGGRQLLSDPVTAIRVL